MSDSDRLMLIVGAIAAAVAVVALVGDRRRQRRRHLDRVGFMPWTPIFFWSMAVAVILLGLVARDGFGA